jgi:hypothetical protein
VATVRLEESKMKIISLAEANHLLLPINMQIGDWNELKSVNSTQTSNIAFKLPSLSLDLYVAASHLADWCNRGRWAILQIDNSSSPSHDEILIFERLVLDGERWDLATQKTFLFDEPKEEKRESQLLLLIYFSAVFSWHVHFTSSLCTRGKRLAIQDGYAYFFGDQEAVETASKLVKKIAEKSLELPSKS